VSRGCLEHRSFPRGKNELECLESVTCVRNGGGDTTYPPHTHRGTQCVLVLEQSFIAALDFELCGLGESFQLYLLWSSGKRMLLQVPCAFFIP